MKIVGTPISRAMMKKGSATAAPVDTTTSGRSLRMVRTASTKLRSRFGTLRVVGQCAHTVRSSLSCERASGLSKETQIRSRPLHQVWSASSWARWPPLEATNITRSATLGSSGTSRPTAGLTLRSEDLRVAGTETLGWAS
jgi:hypothetical protein